MSHLLLGEIIILVDPLLLNRNQGHSAGLSAVGLNSSVRALEVVHSGHDFLAELPGLLDEVIKLVSGRHPKQLVDSGADPPVQVMDSVSEQEPLLRVKGGQNCVVVLDHEQNVLLEDPEALPLALNLHGYVGDLQPEPLPVLDLVEEAQEHLIEVHAKQARLVCLLNDQVGLQLEADGGVNAVEPLQVLVLHVLLHGRGGELVGLVELLEFRHLGQVILHLHQEVHGPAQPLGEGEGPHGRSGVLWQVRARWGLLPGLIKVLLHHVELLQKGAEGLCGLLLHAALDGFALRDGLEGQEQLDAADQGGHALKGHHCHIGEHHLEVLDSRLEDVVIIVPAGGLDIQNVVLETLEAGHEFLEAQLNVLERLGDLRAVGAPKGWEVRFGCKLELGLAHLKHVPATLDEGVRVGKDGRDVKVPRLGLALADGLRGLQVSLLPLLSGLDGLLQENHALFHVSLKDFRE